MDNTITIPKDHYKRLIALAAQLGTVAMGEAERYNNLAMQALQTGNLKHRANFVAQGKAAALIGNSCINEIVLAEEYGAPKDEPVEQVQVQ